MCGRSILSICFVLLLALSGNARAEDLDPPDFAGAEQTGVVFWEFQEDSDQPTSSIYDPPYMYDPELVDPVFGFRYYSGAWQWQQGAGINGDGAMLMVDEESVVQPVPAGDGANLTEYVQVTWQGPGPFGIGLEIWGGGEDWPGGVEFPDEYMGGEEGLAPIEEYDLGNGWTQSIFTATFPADGVTFVHIICHLDVVGDYLVDQIVVDMVIHDGDVPPMGPGRVGGAQPELASRPSPADAEEDVLPDNVLSWTPGDFAATHNVYFGTVFDDVNEADTNSALLVSPGQTDSAYVPAKILDWGQEYFWRVDEVNDADPNSPWKGDTWSFTVEPYTYALDPEEDQLLADDITVSSSEVDSWPDATIWDGLDGDEHSIEGWAMWLSGIDPDGAWIQYPFDKAYKLSEILIWNYNEDIEPILGFGFNETIIEYSTDEGETFVELATVNLNQAPGEPTGPTDILDLQGVVATNLRLTANSNFSGGFEEQFGLSAVRILYLPVRAMDPAPEPEEVVDLDDLVLQWRAGREATSHKVYFGNDPEDLALMETATETSYEPDGLAFDQEYFWRVDETDDPLLAGNVWSFITKDHLVVDDMEDYEDSADDPEVAVFGTWADGWLDPTNGSVVGDEFGATEKEITHDESDQSMPFSYDNTGDAVTSEATRTFDQAQDWTQFDIKALTFYVLGIDDNFCGQMYIKVNDVEQAVAVELAEASWQEVNIALADFAGVNLESVVSLTIGIGGANSSGTAYIDNIRLYPSRCLAETDLQGDVNGDCLVDEEDLAIITDNWLNTPMHAEYTFDTDLSDTSGNGRTGVDVNSPAVQGGVLTLDGTNFVDIPLGADNPFDGSQDFSIALDFQAQMPSLLFSSARDDTPDNHAMSIFVHNWDEPDWGEVIYDQYYIGGAGSEDNPLDGEWHSVVVTYSATDELIRVYLDGEPGWDGEWNPDIPDIADDTVRIGGSLNSVYPYEEGVGNLAGSIDNVRIFSFVLSGDDVAGLADGILPEHPIDLNGDGIVDQADKDIVEANLGATSVWP